MVNSRLLWLLGGVVLGAIVGLNAAGIWPQIPVHAVATHGQDNFAIATGSLDDNLEAIFVLDSVTGDLKGAALNVQSRRFNTWYDYNVSRDLPVGGIKNPQYRIVTGYTGVRQVVAAGQLGRTVVYVAEANTGQLAAYGVPWVAGRFTSPIPLRFNLQLLDRWQFRSTPVQELTP